eukprot:g13350.t2
MRMLRRRDPVAAKKDLDEGDLSKVEEQLRILNSAGNLNQDLPLLNLGVDQALEILSHVEEKAGESGTPMASDDEGHTNGAPAPSDLSEILEFSVNTESSGDIDPTEPRERPTTEGLVDFMSRTEKYLSSLVGAGVGVSCPSVVRAVPCHEALSWLGYALRASHADPYLHLKSRQVEEIQEFWSHSWHSFAWKKILCLLWLKNGKAASIMSAIAATTGMVLSYLDVLPVLVLAQGPMPVCLWSQIIGLIVFFATVFLWRRKEEIFLDCCCIDSTNGDMKVQAIRSIGGILKRSQRLLLLWDPTYVERFWCIFETYEDAWKEAFSMSHPLKWAVEIGVHFPVVALAQIGSIQATGLQNSAFRWHNGRVRFQRISAPPCPIGAHCAKGLSATGATAALMLIVMYAAIWTGISYYHSVEVFKEQMMHFKLAKTKCWCCSNNHTMPDGRIINCDREIVSKCLIPWFGGLEEFESAVAQELATAVPKQLGEHLVPWNFLLSCTLPVLWLWVGRAGVITECYRRLQNSCLFGGSMRVAGYWLGSVPLITAWAFFLAKKMIKVYSRCGSHAATFLVVILILPVFLPRRLAPVQRLAPPKSGPFAPCAMLCWSMMRDASSSIAACGTARDWQAALKVYEGLESSDISLHLECLAEADNVQSDDFVLGCMSSAMSDRGERPDLGLAVLWESLWLPLDLKISMLPWSLARLGISDPAWLHLACVELLEKRGTLSTVSSKELSNVAWSLGMSAVLLPAVQGPLAREAVARLRRTGEDRPRLSLDDLVNTAWGFSSAPDPALYDALQAEMLRHVARRAHTAPTRDAPVSEWSDVVAAALGTTWACRFADMLRLPFLRALRATCARYGAHLDRRQPFLGYSRLPPTDGRAGVSAFFDLQLQLHAGEIERDYLLLCHGLCQRHHFDASLAWRGNEPTRAAGQGKPSKSWVKPMAQGFLKQEAMTMAAARIGTGRRHQLRSHFSFSGYPVVSDQFYTSEEVFQRDCTFSAKTFLHRVRLSFFAGTPSEGRREVLLAPPDLALLQQLNGHVGADYGHERRGKGVIKTQLKEKAKGSHFDHASVEKVKKRISWLNDKAGLNESLNYDKVGELLLSSGPIGEVMKIFKTLEENASEIRNPNGWAVSAARRLAEEGVAPEPKSSKPNQDRDFRNEPLDKQLRAHIVWLNKEVPLNAPLEYEQVAQPLLSLDTREAGEILRRLEESAKEVRDPNGYVVKAAQRQLNDHRKGGGKSERKREREVPEPPQREARFSGSQWERAPPPRPPPSAEGDKIARRVQWLNQHVKLAAPLDYDRLATSFRSLGYYQSLEVLNNLEENASSVRDPTAYVLTGIRKIEEGAETFSGGGGRQQRPPPSASGPRLRVGIARIARGTHDIPEEEGQKRATSLPPRIVPEEGAAASTWRYVIQFGNNSGVLRQLMRARRICWAPAPGDPGHSAGGGSYQERRVKLKATVDCPEINFLWTQYRCLAFLNAMASNVSGLRVQLNEEKTLKLKGSKAKAKAAQGAIDAPFRCHNHFEGSGAICTKRGLCESMSAFLMNAGHDPFAAMPLTFIVENSSDPQFAMFEDRDPREQEAYQSAAAAKQRIWIVKPAEWANRGCGIRIYTSIEEVRARVDSKERAWAIQKYIERPLLIHNRKFDIRAQLIMQKLSVGDFSLGKTLGTGAFGRVRFVTHKASGRHYALKTLKKAAIIKMKQVDHIMSEKQILAKLQHPFIVNMFGSFHDPRYIYMVLEYIVGGEFFTHLRKAGRFENEQSLFYAAQITCIFEYCHELNIVYRDLKPENILINADGYVKLTDFGFAKVIEHRTYTLCGTPEYIAPEVLLKLGSNKGHGKPVDWWTLGILIYEMIVGYPPFVDEDPMGIYQKILAGKITFPKIFHKEAKSLVKKLLTPDLGKRFGNLKNGAADIKEHKWFKDLSHLEFSADGSRWDDLLAKKVEAPFKPSVKGATDTSNFDDYPDSDQEPPAVNASQDPFTNW